VARERGREYADEMMELSYRRHRFPPVVIQHAVWLYLRFTLSFRDVEDLLADQESSADPMGYRFLPARNPAESPCKPDTLDQGGENFAERLRSRVGRFDLQDRSELGDDLQSRIGRGPLQFAQVGPHL
jgi:hypothetical protein